MTFFLTANTAFAIILLIAGTKGLLDVWGKTLAEIGLSPLIHIAQIFLAAFLIVITLEGVMHIPVG